MTTPNSENNGCVDHEKGIQMICNQCPPCFKGTKEVCKAIQQRLEQVFIGK